MGDNERESGTVTYRKYGQKEQVSVSLEEFNKLLKEEVESKKR